MYGDGIFTPCRLVCIGHIVPLLQTTVRGEATNFWLVSPFFIRRKCSVTGEGGEGGGGGSQVGLFSSYYITSEGHKNFIIKCPYVMNY